MEINYHSNLFITSLLVYIIYAFLNWIIFSKAGEKGWKILIPIYNLYIIQKLAFGSEKAWYFIFYFLPVINIFYILYVLFNLGRSFGFSIPSTLVYMFLWPIMDFYLAFSSRVHYQGPKSHPSF